MGKRAQLEVRRMKDGALWDTLSICLDKLVYEYGLNVYERNAVINDARDCMCELRWRTSQLSLLDPKAAGS